MKLFTLILSLFFSVTVLAQDRFKIEGTASTATANRSFRTPQKQQRKNIIQIEALGRGFLYGIGYERMLGMDVSIGASFSYAMVSFNPGVANSKLQVMSLPMYVTYYLNPGRHNFLMTGGINLLAFDARAGLNDSFKDSAAEYASESETDTITLPDLELSGSGVLPIPQAGVGYEYRSHSGFMTRANLYGMYAIGQFIPWAGVSIGVAF